MSEQTKPNEADVTYLGDVVTMIKEKLDTAVIATRTKVLPGARTPVIIPLMEANALLASVSEVLERSGMGKRLGFIKQQNGIQPVMSAVADMADKATQQPL